MHYFIIIAVIAVIVVLQIKSFLSTKKKLAGFIDIFALHRSSYNLAKKAKLEGINTANNIDLQKMLVEVSLQLSSCQTYQLSPDGESIPYFKRDKAIKQLTAKYKNISGITTNHTNAILNTIINSINSYLSNNKGKDFHLMKDIVDRNCDAVEEEIHTQIPVPLYLGLVGTMIGILLGVGFLVFSGGLADLLNSGSSNGSGAQGVETLMGGVGLAMISSIIGIILTTWGSNLTKNAKVNVEQNKNTFLSWLQAELLPTMDDGITHTLEKMTGNLTDFNDTFSNNTSNLGEALAKVNESYKLQKELIEAVNKIQAGRLTSTNLELLNNLLKCSGQIGTLAEYLENTNGYLANVRALNEKLDLQESRTRAIEEVGAFFKTELEQIEARKGVISKAVGTVDDYLKQALEKLKESTEEQFNELLKSSVKQQDILQQKSQELEKLVTELKQLSAVKDSISKFEKAMNAQNGKLDNLANAIHALAKSKVEGTNPPIFIESKMQGWKRILIGTTSILVGLTLIAFIVANWNSIYQFLSDIFKI